MAKSFLLRFATEEGKRFDRFDPEVEAVFLAYAWPGDVRQLQNVVVLYGGDRVIRDMLPSPLDAIEPGGRPCTAEPPVASGGNGIRPLKDLEREAIAYLKEKIPQAAAALGVSLSTIYRKRQTWDNNAG